MISADSGCFRSYSPVWRGGFVFCLCLTVAACHHPANTNNDGALPAYSTLLNLEPSPVLVDALSAVKHIHLLDPGYLVVRDGRICGESRQPGREELVLFEATETLPGFVADATVLLNGWEMSYLDGGDHEIGRLGIELMNIRFNPPQLTWQVRGFLRDHDFEEPYQVCAYYTVIGWDPTAVHILAVDGEDGHRNATYSFFPEFKREHSSLISFASYLHHTQFTQHYTTTVLPRGFAMGWEEGFDQADHDLLHIAYHRQPPVRIIGPLSTVDYIDSYGALPDPGPAHPQLANPGTALANRGYISWITSGIFKDDRSKRGYFLYDVFSGLSGGAITTIEPPYVIRPRKKVDGGLAYTPNESGPVREEVMTVRNLPFRYAIPVLTGWSLAYPFKDEEVKRLGTWIGNSHYDYNAATGTGTLSYSVFSVLHDDEHKHNAHHVATNKTMVLGLDRNGAPDLLPVATGSGSGSQAFCTVDGSGISLVITIANRGDSAAPHSTTEVRFSTSGGEEAATLNTPSIPSTGQATVTVPVPATCYSAGSDCNFSITANSGETVFEADNSNNTAAGVCTG